MKFRDLLNEEMSPEEIKQLLKRGRDAYKVLKKGIITLGEDRPLDINYVLPDEYEVEVPNEEKKWRISSYRQNMPHVILRADQCRFFRTVEDGTVNFSLLYVQHYDLFRRVRKKFKVLGVYLEDTNHHVPND